MPSSLVSSGNRLCKPNWKLISACFKQLRRDQGDNQIDLQHFVIEESLKLQNCDDKVYG